MNKVQLKRQQRMDTINFICSLNPHCSCGYSYTIEDIQPCKNLEKLKQDALSNVPIFLKSHIKCKAEYIHRLSVKLCEKCGKEIAKCAKTNLCKTCLYIEKHVKICPYCGKTVVVKNLKERFIACDNCWKIDKLFTITENKFNTLKSYISKQIENNNVISDLLFNKFYNKKNKSNVNYLTSPIKWHKFKYEKYIDIFKAKEKLIAHFSLLANKFNFSTEDVDNVIYGLEMIQQQKIGFISNADLDTCVQFNFETELYEWKNLLNDNFNNVITILNTFILNNGDGRGEFLWTIIRPDVICNYTNQADILFDSENKGEIKCGNSKTEAGRLIIARDNYKGLSQFNGNIKSYMDSNISMLTDFLNTNNINDKEIFDLIYNADVNDFYWNGVYDKILNKLKIINVQLASEFVKLIFMNSITKKPDDFINRLRFLDYDLTNPEYFKIFHIINYCLYYYYVDLKSINEDLSYLIFISNLNVLILSKNTLTLPMNVLIEKLKNWEIVLPSSELTKTDFNSHDRNKNRAPGLYYKQQEN